MKTKTIALLISLVFVSVALGQGTSNHADDPALAVLIDGLGNYSRPISTKSEMAQKFFDQGLRLVYGYYSPEATASFKEALRHDPDGPMPYWGLALALGPIPNSRFQRFPDDPKEEGRKAITEARARAAKGTPVEQALIETLWVRYDSESYINRDLRDAQYIEAARKTYERYPKDLEAAYLYVDSLMTHAAWSYWARDGQPLEGTREAARTLDRILAQTQITRAQSTFTFTSTRARHIRSAHCRKPIGSSRSCRRRATWSTCLRTSTFEPAITTKPSRAISVHSPPTLSFKRTGATVPRQTWEHTAYRRALTHATHGTSSVTPLCLAVITRARWRRRRRPRPVSRIREWAPPNAPLRSHG